MAKKGRAAPDREKDCKEQKHVPSSSSSSSSTSSSALPDSSAMDRDITGEEFEGERPSAEATEGHSINGADTSLTASETYRRIEPREEDTAETGVGVGIVSEVQRKEGTQSESGFGPSSPSKSISLSLPVTLSPTAAAAEELNGQKEETLDCKAAETASQTGKDAKMENVKEESEAEGQPAVVTCIRATESSMPTITCNVRRTDYKPCSFLSFSRLQYSDSLVEIALLPPERSKAILAAEYSPRTYFRSVLSFYCHHYSPPPYICVPINLP
jgi:hypothetical protein